MTSKDELRKALLFVREAVRSEELSDFEARVACGVIVSGVLDKLTPKESEHFRELARQKGWNVF